MTLIFQRMQIWDSVTRTVLVSDTHNYNQLYFEILSSILIFLYVFVTHLSKLRMVWFWCPVKFPVLLQLSQVSKLGHDWPTFILKQFVSSFMRTYSSLWCWWSHKPLGLYLFPSICEFTAYLQHLHSMEWVSSGWKVVNEWKDRAKILGAREHLLSREWVQGELGKSVLPD